MNYKLKLFMYYTSTWSYGYFRVQEFSCVPNTRDFFPQILLPSIILCAQINRIGRNQVETLVLARFGRISLAKGIQPKEADVQFSSCSTINSKVWIRCVSNKLLELKDAGSSKRLVTSHNIAVMKSHTPLKMYLNFRVLPSPTNKFQ